MTKRAEKLYLSFFEGDHNENQFAMAAFVRQLAEEILPEDLLYNKTSTAWREELLQIAEELKDPELLTNIYGL